MNWSALTMYLIMMFAGVVLTLFLKGVLCQQRPAAECDLVMDGAPKLASDEKSQSFFNIDELKFLRPDESTAVVTGKIVILKDFKENFMLRIVVNKEKMGKTMMVFSYNMCDFCAEMRNEQSQFKKELDAVMFPRECPFEAGKFDVQNLTFHTDDIPVNARNEGIYEAELCMHEARDKDCMYIDLQGCIVLPFTIECSYK